MENLLMYIIQVIVSMGIFYGFFYLFLRKDTLFTLQRIFLLGSFLISFILPLISLKQLILPENSSFHVLLQSVNTNLQAENTMVPGPNRFSVLFLIYLFVSTGFTAWIIHGLLRIMHILRESNPSQHNGVEIKLTRNQSGPFTFWNHIFIPDHITNHFELNQIIEHEKVHASQMHTIDTLLLDIGLTLMWFNPFIWLYRKSLMENHEFLADSGTLKTITNPTSYKKLIVESVMEYQFLQPIRQFNNSHTKNRLIMINKKKTRKTAAVKLLLLVPVIPFLLYSFTSINNPNTGLYQNFVEESSLLDFTLPSPEFQNPDSTFDVVDEMPQFTQGGNEMLRTYIAKQIKYPKACLKKGIQGEIYVSFTVSKEGKVEDPKILKAKTYIKDGKKKKHTPGPELEEESLRVVSELPDFTPGKHEGKPVRVKMTLPINYKLSDEKKDKKK